MASPATRMVGLELLLGCRADARWDEVLLPLFPVLCFLQHSRKRCHRQSQGCSLSQGLGPPALTLRPASSLHFGSASPLSAPPSLGNTFKASVG